MVQMIFHSGKLLIPGEEHLRDGFEVLVEGDTIREVTEGSIRSIGATRVDLNGMTLMPGLIDMHVHVVSALVNDIANSMAPPSLAALRAAKIMKGMLFRGFTTVRDVGGADLGLAMGVEERLIEGPRLIICGKGLGQTGGHSDSRDRFDGRAHFTGHIGQLGQVCDGVDGIRLAAREQLRAGANFIKIMGNGGVASPADPIHALGFSRDELNAVVEEAENAGTYVAAHLYTDKSIARAVECGVHSLEHCNLIGSETARLAARAGCFAVPTLVTHEALSREGAKYGLPPESIAKIDDVRLGGLASLSTMREAKLPMAFGTDLLGELHWYQMMEFEIRARVLPLHEIVASATTVAAQLCRMEGRVGEIVPGALADMLVVDGNPLQDPTLFKHDGGTLRAILQGGRFVKNELN